MLFLSAFKELRFARLAEPLAFIFIWAGVVLLVATQHNPGEFLYNRSNRMPMPMGVFVECVTKIFLFHFIIHFLLPRLLFRGKAKLFAVTLILSLVSVIIIETLAERALVPGYYPGTEIPPFVNFFMVNLTGYFSILTYAFMYGFLKAWRRSERQKQRLVQEKLETELAFLKAQVNPHFLFNTLNNLFSMATMHNSPETATGIAKLASMMRYMLYESNVDRIPLEKEINYIQSFIELQRLRFSEEDDINLSFELSGNSAGKEIAPMLLIPFVENAFKHSITLQDRCEINIQLHIENNQLRLLVENTVNRLRNTHHHEASGLGMVNVQRRLSLLYPNRHKLIIEESEQYFKIHLEVAL